MINHNGNYKRIISRMLPISGISVETRSVSVTQHPTLERPRAALGVCYRCSLPMPAAGAPHNLCPAPPQVTLPLLRLYIGRRIISLFKL